MCIARCEVPMHLVGVPTAPAQQPRTGWKHIPVFMCVHYANSFAQMYAEKSNSNQVNLTSVKSM